MPNEQAYRYADLAEGFLGDVLIKVECRKLSELATIKGVFGEKFSVLCAPATLDALRERRVMLTLISNYPEPLEEGLVEISAVSGFFVLRIGSPHFSIRIGQGVRGMFDIACWRESEVVIGDRTTSNGLRIICDRSHFQCGEDVMFSDSIIAQTADQHGIVDLASGAIINDKSTGVMLGDHVWIGCHVHLLHGADIGTGAVIGMDSLVLGNVPPCSLAVGKPARVIRTDMTWSRSPTNLDPFSKRLVQEFEQTHNIEPIAGR